MIFQFYCTLVCKFPGLCFVMCVSSEFMSVSLRELVVVFVQMCWFNVFCVKEKKNQFVVVLDVKRMATASCI